MHFPQTAESSTLSGWINMFPADGIHAARDGDTKRHLVFVLNTGVMKMWSVDIKSALQNKSSSFNCWIHYNQERN